MYHMLPFMVNKDVQIATRTIFLQKYSSLDKLMCKRASCNWLCYINRLCINCHILLNYLVLLWTFVLFAISYLHPLSCSALLLPVLIYFFVSMSTTMMN